VRGRRRRDGDRTRDRPAARARGAAAHAVGAPAHGAHADRADPAPSGRRGMNLFLDAFAWIFSPERLTGSLPLPLAIGQHLFYTFDSVVIAAAIAVPLGWWIGHNGRGREVAAAYPGGARFMRALGLL